ncbi:MAG: hypothetical protein JXA78_14305 [Anaerolineales bacterium]|nr:hypothetical protein [Anaerolineales bacterium]
MRPPGATLLLLIFSLLLATGCGRPPTPPAVTTPPKANATAQPYPAAIPPASRPSDQAPVVAPGSEPVASPAFSYDELGRKAQTELAARLNIPLQSIQIIRIVPDEFQASYLGCPAPWQTPLPLPAIVSGQTIILEANEVRYTYHARRGQLVFCGPW